MKPAPQESNWKLLFILFIFFIALNYFFVGIQLLGAFKGVGIDQGKSYILMLANNPFLALLIGILLTCIIQSSSTTTSIIVGLVGAGTFGENIEAALRIAIPFIMGANIGTSITNTMVSLGHINHPNEFKRAFSASIVHDIFNLLAVIIFFPLQIYTNFLGKLSLWCAEIFSSIGGLKLVSPLKYLVDPQIKLFIKLFKYNFIVDGIILFCLAFVFLYVGKFFITKIISNKDVNPLIAINALLFALIFAVAKNYGNYLFNPYCAQFLIALFMLFTSLLVIVKIMRKNLIKRIEVLFHGYIFKTTGRAFLLGIVITALVQSSSVTTSIIVPLAGAGILTLAQVFPFTLGANIGTTITAILAALAVGQINAVAVAFSHLFFNIFGIVAIYPFRFIPLSIARNFASFCTRNKVLPILTILTVYIIIPGICILIFS